MQYQNNPVSLSQLGEKLGLNAPFSMSEIAEKIGYMKKPVSLSELSKAVDEFIADRQK